MTDTTKKVSERGADGLHHPTTEAALAALVRDAQSTGKQLRVFGSTHSVWRAIVTDSFADNNTPASEVAVVLDQYTQIFEPVADPAHPGMMLVEVQAGCHLGASPRRPVQARIDPQGVSARDDLAPSPWHVGSWAESLNEKLQGWKLALSDLGGITHQTVAGFLATGSSGGTTKWSIHAAIAAMRIIDGHGNVTVLKEDGTDPEWFRAAGVAMGLCGVVSTVTLRCEPTYDIVGTETISSVAKCPCIDFYGDRRDPAIPSLESFLLTTDYTRLMWWPQWNFDRLVVWQAQRAPFDPDRKLKPYQEIATLPVLSQMAASVVYTILGNLEHPERMLEQIRVVRAHPEVVARGAELVPRLRGLRGLPAVPQPSARHEDILSWITALAKALEEAQRDPVTMGAWWLQLIELFITAADEVLAFLLQLPLIKEVFGLLGSLVPAHIDAILSLFVTSGPDGAPTVQDFSDRWYFGLPMDNQMDDLLLPTWFTELWIPFTPGDGKVQGVIDAMRTLFQANGTPEGAYAATGAFAFELYAAKADETFFMSPSTGSQNVFRVDVFWFAKNAGDPVTDFYPQFWKALERFDYRLHWGKFLPRPDAIPPAALTGRFPGFETWKAVRARVDPSNVFLTRYWREQLGL